MTPRTKVSRTHPLIAKLLNLTFPDYRGRKITVEEYAGPRSYDLYWSGGTRDELRLVDFQRGVASIEGLNVHPAWNPDAYKPIDQPEGSVLAVHTIFCGHDLGVRFIVREPTTLAAIAFRTYLLGAGDEVTQ